MPGVPNIRATRTGRISKAPQTKSRKGKKVVSDGDYEPEEEDEFQAAESQSLDVFEKKVKELKKSAISKNYTDKFSHKAKPQEQNVIKTVRREREKIMKSSCQFDSELAAIFQQAVAENKSLGMFEAFLMDSVYKITDMHKPIQGAIASALANGPLGKEWATDGEDAIRILSQLTEDGLKSVDRHIKQDGKPDSKHISAEYKDEPWAVRVRKLEKGMRRAMRSVPIPVEAAKDE